MPRLSAEYAAAGFAWPVSCVGCRLRPDAHLPPARAGRWPLMPAVIQVHSCASFSGARSLWRPHVTLAGLRPMFIKIGFDIELSVVSPMALIYLLHVHPSRQGDLLAPEFIEVG